MVRAGAAEWGGLPQRERLAVLWAQEALPFRLLDQPKFRAVFGPSIPVGFDRRELSTTTEALAGSLREDICKRVKGQVVTLAIDGWTSARAEKNINFVVLHGGYAFFVGTEIVEHQDEPTLTVLFRKHVKLVQDEMGAFIICVVADNATAYQSSLDTLVDGA